MGKSRSLFSLSYMGDNVHFARLYRLTSLPSPCRGIFVLTRYDRVVGRLDPLLCSTSFTSVPCKLNYAHFLSIFTYVRRINGQSLPIGFVRIQNRRRADHFNHVTVIIIILSLE